MIRKLRSLFMYETRVLDTDTFNYTGKTEWNIKFWPKMILMALGMSLLASLAGPEGQKMLMCQMNPSYCIADAISKVGK